METFKNLIICDEEFNGVKFKTLYLVTKDDKKYKIGTLKDMPNCSYINCIHKEYKKK